MREVFDGAEQEPARPRQESELTLGSGALMAVLVGVVLLCVLCFGLGYGLGRRGVQQGLAAMLPNSGEQANAGANGAQAKPSAGPQAAASAPQTADADPPASDTDADAGSATLTAAEGVSAPAAQPQVRPALAVDAGSAQSSQVTTPLMVQIAAVSHVEDAQVLAAALRKRGYAVVARREPADNLIHVSVGPFNSRDEANRWRTKLLGDGYNAVVLP